MVECKYFNVNVKLKELFFLGDNIKSTSVERFLYSKIEVPNGRKTCNTVKCIKIDLL